MSKFNNFSIHNGNIHSEIRNKKQLIPITPLDIPLYFFPASVENRLADSLGGERQYIGIASTFAPSAAAACQPQRGSYSTPLAWKRERKKRFIQ